MWRRRSAFSRLFLERVAMPAGRAPRGGATRLLCLWLLASLRDMVDWLDDGNRQLSESASADVLKARAALSKATGLPQP